MDQHFQRWNYQLVEVEHQYGERVHLLSNPLLFSQLATFSCEKLYQPALNQYIQSFYQFLLNSAVNYLFPRKVESFKTRMQADLRGEVIDPSQKAITVSLARAGIYPSQVLMEELSLVLNPENVRQDHFYLNRKTNEKGEVIGVDVSGSKIGGGQERNMVIFPDPMGATGSSLCHVLSHYKNEVPGTAKKYIALHLIITPEYIREVSTRHPDLEIFALRLDRGLSTAESLEAIPGSTAGEKGLNEKQYIIPGAGGVGEVLNNSYV